MSSYWLGVLTVPALFLTLAVLWLLVEAVASGPSWTERWCYARGCDRHDYRSEHPLRPWWVWALSWRRHLRDARHRRWRATHMVKTRWWGRWRTRSSVGLVEAPIDDTDW